MSASAPWTANVLTLFPEMFPGPLGHSLAGRARAEQDALAAAGEFARDPHADAPRGQIAHRGVVSTRTILGMSV